ncbi:MAG: hypothetical protein C4551_02635 [Bacillota bacterium]|nr:MAG: hypothetical protein C4551_02635 [Bacillota bacterium]
MAVVLVGVLGLAAIYLARPRGTEARPEVGARAPAITVTDNASGAELRLPDDRAGQPYALAFFSYT